MVLSAQAKTPTAPSTTPDSKVVLTVNGHKYTGKEVADFAYAWNPSMAGQIMTIYQLVQDEAVKRGVKVTDAQVSQEVATQLQQFQASIPKGTSLEEALQQRGSTRFQLTHMSRIRLLLKGLTELDFKPDKYVKVAVLVIQPKSPSTDDAQAAIKSANAAYDALQKGQSWDTVLSQYATEPRLSATHGEIGWAPLEQLPPDAQTQIKTLKVNGFTKPLQSPSGWQIFRLEANGKDASTTDISEMKSRFLQNAPGELVNKLMKEAKITTAY